MSNNIQEALASGLFPYENLDYGIYTCEDFNFLYTENIKYNIADAKKLNVRAVRLPEGKSNLIYVLSDSFENCIEMIKPKVRSFIMTPIYKKVFYPQLMMGSFMKRRFRFNVLKAKDSRMKEIMSTGLRMYPNRNLVDSMDNYIIFLSDIYENIKPLAQRYPLARLMKEFFFEFDRILKEISPKKNEKDERIESNNRIVLIDTKNFGFQQSGSIEDNKTNPLYLLYISYLRLKDLSTVAPDIDFLITASNMFMKFNPSKLTREDFVKFKMALFRIINANLDKFTDEQNENDEQLIDRPIKDQKILTAIGKKIEPFTKPISDDIKNLLVDAVTDKVTQQKAVENPEAVKEVLFKKLEKKPEVKGSVVKVNDDEEDSDEKPDYEITETEPEDTEVEKAEDTAIDAALNDKKIANKIDDEIQDKISPMKNMKTAQVSSARDLKLREAQKKVRVQNSTIEEILARDANNARIQETDKTNALKTINPNVKKIRFINFNKTYLEEVYTKDVVSVFDQLKDKSSPFYITDVKVEDSSTIMDYKETWTVKLVDETGKQNTLKIDLPKFYENRFLLVGGNRYTIINQNLYNILTKDNPNTVIMTTNYNKVFFMRKDTKSFGYIEKMFSVAKKLDDISVFLPGNTTADNFGYVNSLEYDEYGKRLFFFKSNGCEIYFSRKYIDQNLKKVEGLKDNEFLVGSENGKPIIINEETGLDRNGRTITDIIVNYLPPKAKEIHAATKAPSQPIYAECKMAGQIMPVVSVLVNWIGISKLMQLLKINYTFIEGKKTVSKTVGKDCIKFADGVLEYDNPVWVQLLINGLNKMKPEGFKFEDFDNGTASAEFVKSIWGTYKGLNDLQAFHEFLLDPITQSVCRDLNYPDNIEELFLYAIKLLTDEHYVNKASDKLFRTRSCEIIPGILHAVIAQQYKEYIRTGRKNPLSVKQNAVISKLVELQTVEEYSTLNPPTELKKMSSITGKGYKGSNSDDSWDAEKRSYDPTSLGKLGMSSEPNGSIGVLRQLVIEPTIANARGYREPVENLDDLKDVNIMSPIDAITPGVFRQDDPMRVAMTNSQTTHIVPTSGAVPAMVSNGYDESLHFHLSKDFVINAEDDGEVVEVNQDVGMIIVAYKNGKHQAINVNPQIVKNSGGGFYLANKMRPTYTKVGDKFKKDEPLAYHNLYFKWSRLYGLRYCIGPILKVAYMDAYNTYEDAGMTTQKASEKMVTDIVYQEPATFKKNTNILYMAKIGDHIKVGDPLIRFTTNFEDDEISKYLSKLSDENKVALEDELKTEIKSSHAGHIIDIKVYTLLPPSELSPSLGKIVQEFFDKGLKKKKLLEKYDKTPGIMKCGYLFTDSTEPVVNKYNKIKGKYKGVDVLIEFYLEHSYGLGIGDKVAMYSANKNIVSEMVQKGYEPYSEFRPDEEISMVVSPGTVNRRMVTSVIPICGIYKVLIELKRKIKDIAKFSGNSAKPVTEGSLVYDSGVKEKITDFSFKQVFFGSPNKIESPMKVNGPLFITPYIGIASIFAVRPDDLDKYGVPKGVKINRAYKEWYHTPEHEDELMSEPLKELHVILQGAPDIKEITEKRNGYIYMIDMTEELKNKLYRSSNMDRKYEYVFEDLNSVEFSKEIPCEIDVTISGGEIKNPNLDYSFDSNNLPKGENK